MKTINVKPVYKVVRRTEKRLVSAFSLFHKVYAIGKVTLPLKGTKLFAFTNKKQAIEYALEWGWGHGAFEVYRAIGTNVHRNGWLNWAESLPVLKRLFSKKGLMDSPSQNHNSSVVCDSIKLIKRIY